MSEEYAGPAFIEVGKLFYFPEEKAWQIEMPATNDYVTTTAVIKTEDFSEIVAKIKEKASVF